MNSKKWIKILLILCAFGIGVVGLFNYKVDSFGIIQTDNYLDKAAKDLADGKIIAGLQNFDERIFRKKIIENINYKIDWVAIGSSRTMQLRKNMFLNEDKTFQNYSVSGASLEDYLAILQVHKNKFKEYPKNVILGIDPWVLNKYNNQKRYLQNEYNQFLKIIKLSKDLDRKKQNIFSKIFSIEYTVENIKFFKNNYKNKSNGYYVVNNINIDDYLREPDGSIQYPFKFRNPDFIKVKEEAISYTKGSVYSLENFEFLNIEIFEAFISFLKSEKINIIFYLPPYNPYTYDILIEKDKYKIINEVEEYLIKLASKKDIKVLGSYNPHKYNLKNENFFDGMHSLDNVYEKIFQELKYDLNKTSDPNHK